VVATIEATRRHVTSETPASGANARPMAAVEAKTATTASSRIGATSSTMRLASIVSAA
jgi:hypothetical protein